MNINYKNQILTSQNLNNTPRKNKNLSFKSNPNSVKLMFKKTDFFINIKGYGKDLNWAEKVLDLTDRISKSMRKNIKFDKLLAKLAVEMKNIRPTYIEYNGKTINTTGVLRTKRKGYGRQGTWAKGITPYWGEPYSAYKLRFNQVKNTPLKTQYNGVDLTRIVRHKMYGNIMLHGSKDKVNSAMDIIGEIYEELNEKYISQPKNVTNKSLNEINSKVAEIRWIFAHATPFERGSDSIANSFMRALYKSMGIKTYPSKKGVSFDLQAYCTELTDYKKNFATYFKKSPKVIENKENNLISRIIKLLFDRECWAVGRSDTA